MDLSSFRSGFFSIITADITRDGRAILSALEARGAEEFIILPESFLPDFAAALEGCASVGRAAGFATATAVDFAGFFAAGFCLMMTAFDAGFAPALLAAADADFREEFAADFAAGFLESTTGLEDLLGAAFAERLPGDFPAEGFFDIAFATEYPSFLSELSFPEPKPLNCTQTLRWRQS